MDINWIKKEPIDFEYKQYLLLDYFQKVDADFDSFKLYPRFREISLHLANIKSIRSDSSFISLKKRKFELDEEVIMSDLIFEKMDNFTEEERLEIDKIAAFADEEFTKLFMIGKTLWDLIYESISLDMIQYKSGMREKFGFIVVNYFDIKFIYQYEVAPLRKKSSENKLKIQEIYCGTTLDIHQAIVENAVMVHKGFEAKFSSVNLPIFEFSVKKKFDFTHSVLPLVKRKVLSYIKQSFKTIEINF